MTGKIHRLLKDKHYGFIRGPQNTDYFFHESGLKNVKLDELEIGQEVEFEDEESDKGLRAVDIFA